DLRLRLRWLPDLRTLRSPQCGRHRRNCPNAQQLPTAQYHPAHHPPRRHRSLPLAVRPRRVGDLSAGLLRGGLRVRRRPRRPGPVQRTVHGDPRVSGRHLRLLRDDRGDRRVGVSLYTIGPQYYGVVAADDISTHGHVTITEPVSDYTPTWAQVPEPSPGGVALGLDQNAPNPLRDGATISFRLPAAGRATIDLYDLPGRFTGTGF